MEHLFHFFTPGTGENALVVALGATFALVRNHLWAWWVRRGSAGRIGQ